MELKYKRIILKLSGEALKAKDGDIYDSSKLEMVARIVSSLSKNGAQIGIVVGGGNIWRGKLASTISMHQSQADYMGMLATVMNALAIGNAIKNAGIDVVTLSSIEMPKVCPLYTKDKAVRTLEKGKVAIFAGGTGNPYFTTDTCAALRALEIDADAILMAKNGVDGVYTADPRVDKTATLIKSISYKEIVDKKLGVMDLTAASLLDKKGIEAVVFNMDNEENFLKVICGEKIGTLIKE